jgi:outer membrane immunogenic protein
MARAQLCYKGANPRKKLEKLVSPGERCALKRFLAATCVIVFALCFAGSAKAQNEFNGIYIGGNAGGAFGRFDARLSTIFSSTGYFASSSVPAIATVGNQKINTNKFTAGGGLGFAHQWDNFVFGIEGDFNYMGLDGKKTGSATYPCCAPTAFTITQTAKTSYLTTLRPRVGWVFGKRVMLYETVGAAFTRLKYTGLFTDTFATAHENANFEDSHVGYAVGGGLEAKMKHHLSVKGEYLYLGLGDGFVNSANLTAFTPPIAFPSNTFTHALSLNTHVARGGVNFWF